MDLNAAIVALSALAQEHRLALFRLLVQAGEQGMAAGAIAEKLGVPNSSLSFHLAQLRGAGLVLSLGSMLHSIAVGNMLPAWVKVVCVDINPAVATKVSDRGTGQAVGVVTDVGLFLDHLSRAISSSNG